MIASLRGRVRRFPDAVIIDVGGVGYLVQMSGRTRAALPADGEEAELIIETQVREDAITLFGFRNTAEKTAFKALMSCKGVGGRVALAILTVLSPDELSQAISMRNVKAIARADGVGPKLAQRVITEIGNVLPDPEPVGQEAAPAAAVDEAMSALGNLGYGRTQAMEAVTAVAREAGPDADAKTLIKTALARLAQAHRATG